MPIDDDFGSNSNVFLNLERPFMDIAMPVAEKYRNYECYSCAFNCLLLNLFKVIMNITPIMNISHSKNELLLLPVCNCLHLFCFPEDTICV